MIRGESSQRILRWSAAMSVVLGIVIAGCSTGDPPGGPQAPGSSLRAQADPPDIQGDLISSSAGVENGKRLFTALGCVGCHTTDGKGGLAGPDLSNEADKGRSRQWLATKIRDPKADHPESIMPANPALSDDQVNSLVDYLLSLTPTGAQTAATALQAPSPAATVSSPSAASGGAMWSRRCGQCHNLRPPSDYSDAQWAVALHHMRVRVPLTGEEQRDILSFLQTSN